MTSVPSPPRSKVLVVDDSALMRELLVKLLSSDPSLDVIGAAADPYAAAKMIKNRSPDVITLDVEMPRMDGLTFLEKLMSQRPTPVVMISSLTERGCQTTLKALGLGAVDFVTKPTLDVQRGTLALADTIIAKVKSAAKARVMKLAERERTVPAPLVESSDVIVALGASTGGTEALKRVIERLPANAPAVLVVQHMPEMFTRAFADRLNSTCTMRVREAQDGDSVLPGHVLIAPGGKQMRIERNGARFCVRVVDEPRVNRHRPSVDVLFNSCAEQVGPRAVGALLTGMGDDGARGLVAMREAGAVTIAQNEETCVVFGMPRAAIERGGAMQVLPLDDIGPAVLHHCH